MSKQNSLKNIFGAFFVSWLGTSIFAGVLCKIFRNDSGDLIEVIGTIGIMSPILYFGIFTCPFAVIAVLLNFDKNQKEVSFVVAMKIIWFIISGAFLSALLSDAFLNVWGIGSFIAFPVIIYLVTKGKKIFLLSDTKIRTDNNDE